jgi:hypothetical protein
MINRVIVVKRMHYLNASDWKYKYCVYADQDGDHVLLSSYIGISEDFVDFTNALEKCGVSIFWEVEDDPIRTGSPCAWGHE